MNRVKSMMVAGLAAILASTAVLAQEGPEAGAFGEEALAGEALDQELTDGQKFGSVICYAVDAYGLGYQWIAPNIVIAQNNVLRACQMNSGTACVLTGCHPF